jgi:hypothetical protein
MEFWDVDLSRYPRWETRDLVPSTVTQVRDTLTQLAKGLAPARLHFGWRVIDDVLDFVAIATRDGGGLTLADALDRAVYSKVLPKLRGPFRDGLKPHQLWPGSKSHARPSVVLVKKRAVSISAGLLQPPEKI